MRYERAGGGADNTTSTASPVGGGSVTPAGMRMVTTGGTAEQQRLDEGDMGEEEEFIDIITENVTDAVDPERTVIYNTDDETEETWHCSICREMIPTDSESVGCSGHCQQWFHVQCAGLDWETFNALVGDVDSDWFCEKCVRPSSYLSLLKM